MQSAVGSVGAREHEPVWQGRVRTNHHRRRAVLDSDLEAAHGHGPVRLPALRRVLDCHGHGGGAEREACVPRKRDHRTCLRPIVPHNFMSITTFPIFSAVRIEDIPRKRTTP